ncbi:hypothetical protein FAI41_07785 [Acetobacteraceae bacterium]|nr:hypothetical protein FAI41_07785 [Acetobacteraceae bacterium]
MTEDIKKFSIDEMEERVLSTYPFFKQKEASIASFSVFIYALMDMLDKLYKSCQNEERWSVVCEIISRNLPTILGADFDALFKGNPSKIKFGDKEKEKKELELWEKKLGKSLVKNKFKSIRNKYDYVGGEGISFSLNGDFYQDENNLTEEQKNELLLPFIRCCRMQDWQEQSKIAFAEGITRDQVKNLDKDISLFITGERHQFLSSVKRFYGFPSNKKFKELLEKR